MAVSVLEPIVIANWDDTSTYEGDCACPSPPIYDIEPIHSTTWHIPSTLYRSLLPDDYQLVFNYLGSASLAVLNEPARRVMNAFHSPLKLRIVPNELVEMDSRNVINTAKQLARLGLLVPIEKLNSLPLSDNPTTLTAWLHVSNACNLRCDYCYINKTSNNMDNELGLNAVEAVFRSACSNGFKRVKMKYAGGEATLNFPLVLTLHRHASVLAEEHGLGLDGVVLSNGVAISDRMIEEIHLHKLRLSISLDGVGKYHNIQRKFINGQGSFANVERTLNRLETHRLKPFISITLTDRNVLGLAEIVEYVIDRDLPFNINFFRDNECTTGLSDLKLRDDRIIVAILQAFAVIERKLPTHSLLGMLVDRAQFNQQHNKTCGVGESYMVIDHKGRVAKCHMEIEKPVTDVFARDPLALIRLDDIGIQNLKVEEKEGCRNCEWRYQCTGGCPLLTFKATGRYDVKSPYCRIYKAVYPEMLRLEGLRLMKLWHEQIA